MRDDDCTERSRAHSAAEAFDIPDRDCAGEVWSSTEAFDIPDHDCAGEVWSSTEASFPKFPDRKESLRKNLIKRGFRVCPFSTPLPKKRPFESVVPRGPDALGATDFPVELEVDFPADCAVLGTKRFGGLVDKAPPKCRCTYVSLLVLLARV